MLANMVKNKQHDNAQRNENLKLRLQVAQANNFRMKVLHQHKEKTRQLNKTYERVRQNEAPEQVPLPRKFLPSQRIINDAKVLKNDLPLMFPNYNYQGN